VQKVGGAAKTDADVCAAITASAGQNAVNVTSSSYVDWNRAPLSAVCAGGAIPAAAAGVSVDANKDVSTYFARLAQLNMISTGGTAMALAGALQGLCAAEDGCGLIPLTFDQKVETCSGSGFIQIGSAQWPLVDRATAVADKGVGAHEVILPLCKNGPGGYGWLDLGSVGCSGGRLETQILTPCNHALDIPIWVQTLPGNNNSANVDAAVNSYDDKIILIPLFDGTCRSVPTTGLLADCTNPGNGNNLYYHIPVFGAFLLDHAYINGSDPECNRAPGGPPVGGNGSTGCIKGWFIRYVSQGPVGSFDPNVDGASTLGVQLVK